MDGDRRIARGLFVLAWVTFAWFYGGAGWNGHAQFDLTRALVERHTLYIDGYDVNTGDVSRGGSHTYSNKPPGVSFLAAIPYAGIYAIERSLRLPVDHLERTNLWISTALTCGLSGALIGAILFLYARRSMHATARAAVAVSLAIVFGTIVFPYSTMPFAHVPAALFLLLAFTLLDERPLAAGVAAGLATCCFYVCAVSALILLVAAARRSRLRFLGGAAPFALALAAYQWRCFGSPFRTAVEASMTNTQKGLLLGVLRLPRLGALYGITLSPYRGLFFAAPVLLFALAGLVAMARDRSQRRVLITIAAIAGSYFAVIASFNGWDGGWAFGPRYVLPVVPFLGIPMLFALRSCPRPAIALWVAAALLSFAVHFIATSTDAMPSPSVHDPIGHYLLPAFFHGRISEETRAAFPWYDSTRVDKVTLPADAGNLGELIAGEGRRSSVMPILMWLIAGSALLLMRARRVDVGGGR